MMHTFEDMIVFTNMYTCILFENFSSETIMTSFILLHLHFWLGGGGGLQNRRGVACEVLPLQKGGGGAEKVLAMLKGGGAGHKKFWGSFYAVA